MPLLLLPCLCLSSSVPGPVNLDSECGSSSQPWSSNLEGGAAQPIPLPSSLGHSAPCPCPSPAAKGMMASKQIQVLTSRTIEGRSQVLLPLPLPLLPLLHQPGQ